MTKTELLKALNAIIDEDLGCEAAHMKAESLLFAFLTTNGHEDIVNTYERLKETIGFWYS